MAKNENEKKEIPRKNKPKRVGFLDRLFLGQNRDYIIENLTLLVDSGMGILSALDSIAEGSNSKRVKRIIEQIKSDIDSGSPLWEALYFSYIFPEKSISLIKIGERSGRLTENLKVVAQQQQKERVFNSKIKGALVYPVFILVVAVIVGIGITWFLLPKLALVFSQLRIKLPLITQIFIGAGVFLGQYGTVVVPSFLVVFILFIYFIFFFKYTKIIGQFIAFKSPIFKRIMQQIELVQFGYSLGSLLEAGTPITESIRLIKETTNFYNYRKFYSFLESSIEEGNSFQKSFSSYKNINKLFPTPVQQMIVAAEKSGHLSAAFKQISDVYEEKLDNTTKNLGVILEPVLLIIVWLGVMAVALAVIVPLYGLLSGIKP
jgi:type II secretory pathway component PulF